MERQPGGTYDEYSEEDAGTDAEDEQDALTGRTT